MKVIELLELQRKANERLATVLKKSDITTIRLTSVGNSIAAGYSAVRTIKPLLLRNETIKQVMTNNGIVLERKHFARSQNNNDEHIFNWITTNIREYEINKMNRIDFSNGPTSMISPGINLNGIENYYPINMDEDKGLRDIILESNNSLANIVIYNGCTGSFLDNITRKGKLTDKLMYGIKKDKISLESTLKYIQINNREKGSNTQVYLCGVPNFLGLHISDVINSKLKNISDLYANVTYVEPVKSKCFYKKLDNNSKISLPQVDIHYDEMEYLKLNTNIIESISDNYLVNEALIELDRTLFHESSDIEFRNYDFDKTIVIPYIKGKYLYPLEKYLQTDKETEKFRKKALKYFSKRAPYDFYYLGKDNIKQAIKQKYNTKK